MLSSKRTNLQKRYNTQVAKYQVSSKGIISIILFNSLVNWDKKSIGFLDHMITNEYIAFATNWFI